MALHSALVVVLAAVVGCAWAEEEVEFRAPWAITPPNRTLERLVNETKADRDAKKARYEGAKAAHHQTERQVKAMIAALWVNPYAEKEDMSANATNASNVSDTSAPLDISNATIPPQPAMRDVVNYDAHLATMYARKIDGFQKEYDLIKDKKSGPAKVKMMMIKELELSRGEACRKVLKMHHVNATFVVDPTIDASIGHMSKGYDAPYVPLRKLLSAPKPQPQHNTAPPTHKPAANNPKPSGQSVLHVVPLERAEEEHIVDLGEVDEDQTETAEEAGLRMAEAEVAKIKAQALAEVGNTPGGLKYSVVKEKADLVGEAVIAALTEQAAVCPAPGEAFANSTQETACTDVRANVATLKTENKQFVELLKKLSKPKEQCNKFLTDLKARRENVKSRRRAWGTGVNVTGGPITMSPEQPPKREDLDPGLQRWFPPNKTAANETSANETSANATSVEADELVE